MLPARFCLSGSKTRLPARPERNALFPGHTDVGLLQSVTTHRPGKNRPSKRTESRGGTLFLPVSWLSNIGDVSVDLEGRIRQRAHQMWEEEGQPEGRAGSALGGEGPHTCRN